MILVTGATGFIGRHLVAQLMAQGEQVRCLLPAHRAENLPWETPPEIVVGSILDEEALFRAATGVQVIFHLENAQWWGRPRDLERIEVSGTRSLLTAARAARVGRVITLSHLGASSASAYPLMRVKGQAEEMIKGSGLAYTILRSGLVFGEEDSFINHIAMQLRATPFVFLMPGRGEVVLHPIYIRDVVAALVACLTTLDSVDAVIEIGGPEYITLADLIRTVMRVSGAPRAVISVPPYVLRLLIRIYRQVLPRSLITLQWLDLLATNRTARIGSIVQYFDIRPRRLEDTLLTYMRGRRYIGQMLRYTVRRRPRVI